jgi:hypothetical protein
MVARAATLPPIMTLRRLGVLPLGCMGSPPNGTDRVVSCHATNELLSHYNIRM